MRDLRYALLCLKKHKIKIKISMVPCQRLIMAYFHLSVERQDAGIEVFCILRYDYIEYHINCFDTGKR